MSVTSSLGVGATALDGGLQPVLNCITWFAQKNSSEVLQTVTAQVEILCGKPVGFTLRFRTALANALTNERTTIQTIRGLEASAEIWGTATTLAALGCARMTATTAVHTIQVEVRARPITGRTARAHQQDFCIANCLVSFLIEEPGAEHSRRLGVLESDRVGLMNLHPRQRDRVGARLSRGNEGPKVGLLILAQKAAANDVGDTVRVSQKGRERDRLALRDLADVGAEAEKLRSTVRFRCAARRWRTCRTRSGARGLSLRYTRVFIAHGRRGVTRAGLRHGSDGRCRHPTAVATCRKEDHDAHNFALVLHDRHLATPMTAAQPSS